MGYDANENNILEPFNKLRQVSSLAKVDAAVGLAKDLLEKEGSIVLCEFVQSDVWSYLILGIFLTPCSLVTSFVAVAKEIRDKLQESYAGQLLTGEVVAHKRQQMVDEFQEGVTPVFVCTYGKRIHAVSRNRVLMRISQRSIQYIMTRCWWSWPHTYCRMYCYPCRPTMDAWRCQSGRR